MDLETTYYIVGVGISTINILLCVTVIFVSFYINSKSNEEYAKVIAVNTIIDFTYSVVNALTVSSSFTSSNYIYKFINGPIFVDCSESTANNVLRVHIFFTSLLGVCKAVHFSYKADTLCHSKTWSVRKYCCVYAFFSLFCAAEVVLSIFNISEHNAVTEAEVKEFYVDDDTIPPYIAFGFDNPILKYGSTYTLSLRFVLYVIAFYKGKKIIYVMRLKTYKSKIELAQKHVVRVMILQALYPLLVFVLPYAVQIYFIFTGGRIRLVFFFLGTFPQTMPALNAITVITLIPAYRRSLKSLIYRNEKVTTTVTAVSSCVSIRNHNS